MIITKVSRTYSKSINTANYGVPESWVKVSSTWEAEIESADDAVAVSQAVYEQVQKEVIENCQTIIGKIQEAARGIQNAAVGPGGTPVSQEPRQL